MTSPAAPALSRSSAARGAAGRRLLSLLILLGALVILSVLALLIGTRPVGLDAVIASFSHYDPANADQIVIQVLRIPRLIAGLLVGGALAASGALMQDMTRNPLASPGLMGVNAGAAFGVVLTIWGFGISDPGLFIWPAMIGAGLTSLFVFALGAAGRGGPTPVRYLLAGAATAALLFAVVRGILLMHQETLDIFRFWVVGSLTGIRFDDLLPLLPFFAVGFLAALAGASRLNALTLGEDTARSLGANPELVRLWNMATVTCLCGAAVSLAGPIGFIGLVVPHIARAIFGVNTLHVVIYGSLIGAGLLVAADTAGRVVFAYSDLQAGVTVALLGAPAFIWLVRRTRIMRQ